MKWILLAMAVLVAAPSAFAQRGPYIGYTYPAGGQQGTTFQIKLGGQGLDDVRDVFVTGSGVRAEVVQYYRRLNPQETQLLNEQLRVLKKETPPDLEPSGAEKVIGKIERRLREHVQTPACASISALVFAEVAIASGATPGARELRLVTARGVSNPLVFHVGQFPELSRKAMITATIQVLGKEASALRKRPLEEAEVSIDIPCTVNGQIASGEVNRYRFTARKGQQLVISTEGRQLIPFIADAVPGWFQPVLGIYDANGKELAFADDYQFRPDPVVLFDVPKDGEYVFAITDALYRGREDFVYRITIGEVPFVTSIFPLGAKAGASVPEVKGWNLREAVLMRPARDAVPGIHSLVASTKGIFANSVRFAIDDLPNAFDKEPNNSQACAQDVTLPVIINGRIDKRGDWDVFRFAGKSNDTVVAEVQARRLDSPLDSVIKLTDATGNLLAFNDDHEDLAAGVNTHQADSWFMSRLPADGEYFLHIGDTARTGGEEFGYRPRISPPQPDFELRVAPSSVSLRTNSTANLTVYAQRKDGFAGPIKLELKNPPPGFSAAPVKLAAGQASTRLIIRGPPVPGTVPVDLKIVGTGMRGDEQIIREAVPSEDRMQAFLWRQLVPAKELKALVFDPEYELPGRRRTAVRPPPSASTNAVAAVKPAFTRSQVARRLRELALLYEEGLLTEAFYNKKVEECEGLQ